MILEGTWTYTLPLVGTRQICPIIPLLRVSRMCPPPSPRPPFSTLALGISLLCRWTKFELYSTMASKFASQLVAGATQSASARAQKVMKRVKPMLRMSLQQSRHWAMIVLVSTTDDELMTVIYINGLRLQISTGSSLAEMARTIDRLPIRTRFGRLKLSPSSCRQSRMLLGKTLSSPLLLQDESRT